MNGRWRTTRVEPHFVCQECALSKLLLSRHVALIAPNANQFRRSEHNCHTSAEKNMKNLSSLQI